MECSKNKDLFITGAVLISISVIALSLLIPYKKRINHQMQYLNLFNQIVLISINLPNHPDSNDRQEATDTLNTNEPHPIPDEEFNDGVTPDADTTNTNKSWFKKLQLWFKKKTSREKLTFLLSNEKYKNNEQIRDIEMQFSEHSKLYRKLQIGRIIALIIITIGILLDAISGYYFYLGICSK